MRMLGWVGDREYVWAKIRGHPTGESRTQKLQDLGIRSPRGDVRQGDDGGFRDRAVAAWEEVVDRAGRRTLKPLGKWGQKENGADASLLRVGPAQEPPARGGGPAPESLVPEKSLGLQSTGPLGSRGGEWGLRVIRTIHGLLCFPVSGSLATRSASVGSGAISPSLRCPLRVPFCLSPTRPPTLLRVILFCDLFLHKPLKHIVTMCPTP